MKIVSWNINGINNILHKSKAGEKQASISDNNVLSQLIAEYNPDIICLQEVRKQHADVQLKSMFGSVYPYIYSNHATCKKGYSGTAILSKKQPQKVLFNMDEVNEEAVKEKGFYDEGRIIRAEYDNFVLINVYTPNSKPNLERLEFRTITWEIMFRKLVQTHSSRKNTIICGDLNVAHNDIDIFNPKANRRHAGFTDEERLAFGLLLHNLHLIDAFRACHPNVIKYSWWSNFFNSRQNNRGWRIDYFVIDKHLMRHLNDSDILTDYKGSDHAPITLDVNLHF